MKNIYEKTRLYIKENPRVLLFLYLPVYLLWYFLIERRAMPEYYVSYMPLDDQIPFAPPFILAYMLWFPYLVLIALYLYLRDARAFVRFGLFFIVSITICMLVCTVFPNGQNLRPADTGGGLFGWLIDRIYAADTNTNVLPSMHVVGCFAVCFAAFDARGFRRLRFPILVLGIAICAATVLIKQHSFLDVIWSAVVAAVVGAGVYLAPLLMRGTKGRGRASY
jgi:membrane-associated phospholipid phosphatase